jgi:DNA topoisomerase-3
VNRLWITEKPSAAQNLVAGLCSAFRAQVSNKASSRKDGYFALSNGDIVAPLQGHLIEPVFLKPEHKQARLSEFFDFLPIEVRDFEYEPRPERERDGSIRMRNGKPVPATQYKVVTDLIRKAKEIVNAGDIDREGQLIVDELLMHCGVDPEGRHKPIWRLPLVSSREEDIREQVKNLTERNGDPKWVRRRLAALARQHCDAALGYNASFAYQAATGYHRTSVGRVQSPVLMLVVEREEQIRNFVPRNYFVPVITLADGTQLRFFRRHGAEGKPGFDAEGRIVEEAVARQVCGLIGAGMKGRITAAKKTNGSEGPPLPFSATILASTVAKRTGMTPKEAERSAQSLYERHKAISYVGTDCQFLPTAMLQDARATMTALSRLYPQQAGGATLELRSRAWNDSKVDEHFAIVPTGKLPEGATPEEKAVFDAVARRYMAQFYPAHEFVTRQLAAVFGNDEFRATRRDTVRMGWKEIEGHLEQGGPKSEGAVQEDDESDADRDRESDR